MKNYRIIGGALAALLAGGCTLAPFYHRPPLPVAAQYPGGSGSPPQNGAAASDIGWRDFFKDPQLQKLIELALANNRDLRVASLNVEAARAQYRIQRSDLFPTINASGTEFAERVPKNYELPGTPGFTIHQYEAGVGFTAYEIDFFGRIRSLNKAALHRYFGLLETRTSAQITLISEVAAQYLGLLADQELLRLTRSTYDAQKASFDLTQQRFNAGVSNALDLSQAQTAVDAARAYLAQYARQVMQDTNALVLLLGAPLPADLPAGSSFDDETVLAGLPEGLPSDLLQRRPDIRAAEHQLIAANADIGAARAAFFPSISLTGSYGTASTHLSGLFAEGSQQWVFNPTISMPIFAAGANMASLDLAHVQKRIEIAQYEKAIQTAFREVSDALAGRQTLDVQVAAQEELVKASSDSYTLSDMRFRAGVDNYLTVIVSQRALYSAQQDLISLKLLRVQNLITLYKALGGGWTDRSTSAPPGASATTPSPYGVLASSMSAAAQVGGLISPTTAQAALTPGATASTTLTPGATTVP